MWLCSILQDSHSGIGQVRFQVVIEANLARVALIVLCLAEVATSTIFIVMSLMTSSR